MTIDLTLSSSQATTQGAAGIADALRHILGNTCRLAMTTLNFHWNVEGSQFYMLHKLFEEQYGELWEALDPLAERVRAIGHRAVADYTDNVIVPVAVAIDQLPMSSQMTGVLAQGHAAMNEAIRAAVDVAKDEDDEASVTLLGDRLLAHAKHLWMLRSITRE